MRFLIALLLLLAGSAQACLFVRDVKPAGWFEWSSGLFAGDVIKVEHDAPKALDILTVKIVETFKVPPGDVATVMIPVHLRKSCGMELPGEGARVLVALNAANDSMWLPLSENYAEQLRAHAARQ